MRIKSANASMLILLFSLQCGNSVAESASESDEDLPVIYETREILQSGEESLVAFGDSVAIDGETMAASLRVPDGAGYGSVEIYEFEDGQWNFVKEVRPPDERAYDVPVDAALDGDTLALGAFWHCETNTFCESGAVFIFERDHGGADNWGFVRKVDGGNLSSSWFGQFLALHDDTLVVPAAQEDDVLVDNVGAVYVFERDHSGPGQWGLVKRLESDKDVKEGNDFFGTDVWIHGDTLIVSGDMDNTIYHFVRSEGGADNWGLVQKISSTAGQGEFLPAFDGETLVVRVNQPCSGGEVCQRPLHFYTKDQGGLFELRQEMVLEVAFGRPVVSGNQVLLKSRDDVVAYLLERGATPDSWQLSAELRSSNAHSPLQYGSARALDRGRAVIGEARANDEAGVVFYYDLGSEMNAGHSGAWYFPDTSGQGQFIDVEPDSQFVFLGWFTYTDGVFGTANEQHWFTAEGFYSGNSAELILYESMGGQFDEAVPVTTVPVGTVILSFSGCGQGQMNYQFDDRELQGSFPMGRVIPGSENVCESESSPVTQAVDVNHGMDGAWYDPGTSGQGFFFDVYIGEGGGEFLFVSWFTYGDDTDSGQRWLTAEGNFEGSGAELVIYDTNGGSFDESTPVDSQVIGTMNIEFTDCANAVLSYSMPDEATEGSIDIQRVIPGSQALCEELAVLSE